MYYVNSGYDSADQGRPYFQLPDKGAFFLNEYPPVSQQFIATVPNGPISAPAASTNSGDYFSHPVAPPNQWGATENPQMFGQFTVAQHNTKNQPLNQRRSSVTNKTRHRLHLSQSFTNSGQPIPVFVSSDPETQNHEHYDFNQQQKHHIHDHSHPLNDHLQDHSHQDHADHQNHLQNQHQKNQHQYHPQNYQDLPAPAQRKKKGKKPGFHLALDNLQAPNALHQFQLQMLDSAHSAHSDSSFEMTYHHMQISDPDVLFNHGSGELGMEGQENVTPLMNPPHAAENGYFGGFDSVNSENEFSGYFVDTDMPGGYLSVPRRPEIRMTKSADNNSDMDNYINYPMDEFEALHDLPGGHNLNQYNFVKSEDFMKTAERFVPIKGEEQYLAVKQEEQFRPLISPEINPSPGVGQNQFFNFPESLPRLERSVSAQSAIAKTGEKKSSSKKKAPKGTVCTICDRYISRDFSRHMRIHDEIGRFRCVFPNSCNHRSGKFNRPYDYKKHLLNMHFKFDNPKAKAAPNLTEKLLVWGSCMACGLQFIGNDWLEQHVLTSDICKRCPELNKHEKLQSEEIDRMDQLERIEHLDDSE